MLKNTLTTPGLCASCAKFDLTKFQRLLCKKHFIYTQNTLRCFKRKQLKFVCLYFILFICLMYTGAEYFLFLLKSEMWSMIKYEKKLNNEGTNLV